MKTVTRISTSIFLVMLLGKKSPRVCMLVRRCDIYITGAVPKLKGHRDTFSTSQLQDEAAA